MYCYVLNGHLPIIPCFFAGQEFLVEEVRQGRYVPRPGLPSIYQRSMWALGLGWTPLWDGGPFNVIYYLYIYMTHSPIAIFLFTDHFWGGVCIYIYICVGCPRQICYASLFKFRVTAKRWDQLGGMSTLIIKHAIYGWKRTPVPVPCQTYTGSSLQYTCRKSKHGCSKHFWLVLWSIWSSLVATAYLRSGFPN